MDLASTSCRAARRGASALVFVHSLIPAVTDHLGTYLKRLFSLRFVPKHPVAVEVQIDGSADCCSSLRRCLTGSRRLRKFASLTRLHLAILEVGQSSFSAFRFLIARHRP